MRSWLSQAERMEFTPEFPPEPIGHADDIDGPRAVIRSINAAKMEVLIPDIRRTDILDSRTLVSRKRTLQLQDLCSMWKKIVLEKHTDRETGEGTIHPVDLLGDPRLLPVGAEGANMRRLRSGRMIDLDDDDINVQRRSVSPLWDDTEHMADTYLRVGLR